MRDVVVDKYIEDLFGKPNFSQSFIKNGQVWTPIGNVKLWRIDSLWDYQAKEKAK